LATMSLLEQINNGISNLYKKQGVDYDDLFKSRCEENGFDDEDTLKDELGTTVDDSQLLEDDFTAELCPWINGPDRKKELLGIIQACGRDKDAFAGSNQIKMTDEDWNVGDNDVQKVTNLVKTLAPSLYDGGFSNDKVLHRMMAVEMKMKRNYLLIVADMFMREHIYYDLMLNRYGKGKDDKEEETDNTAKKLTIELWSAQNQHMKMLRNMDKIKTSLEDKMAEDKSGGNGQKGKVIDTPGELMANAIKSYFHRVAPRLMMSPTHQIIGDLRTAALYIASTIDFVANLAKNRADSTCPFQYDTVFLHDELNDVDPDDGGMTSDDGDDDEDHKVSDVEEVKHMEKFENIVEGIQNRGLKHQTVTLAAKEPLREGARPFAQTFGKLKLDKKVEDYPRNCRFCSVVDLRGNTLDEQKQDDLECGKAEVVMFESAQRQGDHDKLDEVKTASNTALGYFHRAKACIIPDFKDKAKDKAPLDSMTLGPHFTLSFQVDTVDDMRCYLFMNGQCARFIPEDIVLLMPPYFVQSEANKAFVESEEALFIIMKMHGKLLDTAFQTLLKENKVKIVPPELKAKLNKLQADQ